MLIYKGKVLTKFKDKKAGKNQSEVDGFYRDPNGFEFFIKKPKDPKELFTELFAGLLLQQFKQRGLIDKIYHDSLIAADLIQFEDGSYGLIQPKISFKELYKIIGTGYRDGSDRDPLTEMFCGPQYYILLTQLKQYFGLPTALMMSLLFGDNSVHSGNVVCLDVISAIEMAFIQFARIDWGAAFRYFGHPQNNEELLNPFEYQGWFNPKGYTKGYFLNYKKIKGLFPAIAGQASKLLAQVDEDLLVDIVTTALKQLPIDIIDNKTKMELAQYLYIESFNNISFGEKGNYQQFTHDIAKILYERLKKITVMHDLLPTSVDSDLSPIQYVESLPTAISLPVNMVTPFAEQMNIWLNILSSSDEKSIFDFNRLERDKLAKQFNCFMENILRQAERLNQYASEMPPVSPDNASESHVLRELFILNADLTPHYSSNFEIKHSYRQLYWQVVHTVLTTSFHAVVTIRVLQNTQNATEFEKASAIHFLFDTLKEHLQTLNKAYQVFIKELETTLSSMSGAQLATICHSEIEFINSSVLIGIIIRNPVLWSRMALSFAEEREELDQKTEQYHLISLQQCHQGFTLFLELAHELPSITQINARIILVTELNRLFAKLPQFLQAELAPTLNKIQDEFREWQLCNEKDILSLEEENKDRPSIERDSNNKESTRQKLKTETISTSHNAENYLLFFSHADTSKPSSFVDESIAKLV
ncbi:LepB GTPase-activating domain-containing protein [Legionella fallonii]|uniref:Effector protein B, substrate of the Dot/Icm secretion system n=1 Tax=Legionella fallonii LLAP-10 TaxID=1212491 RepID=A0A098G267_9GAMM|nr:LepB GTPase-activating domain-containing protein [Legionella fallonii]CEG56059.1 effector protein B, substrate of the Dot/Icm secretion system [Legionella fallonii LLAP-10]